MNDKNRMLLHWVNSLPLTTCLLVDDLLDLRFGNELVDIARWVEGRQGRKWGDTLCNGPLTDKQQVEERVREVVHLVASECRSADGDAVFVVSQAQCVSRIMEGHGEAIAAVLTVLRRLSRVQQQSKQRLSKSRPTADVDKLQALQLALPQERLAEREREEKKAEALSKSSHPIPSKGGTNNSAKETGAVHAAQAKTTTLLIGKKVPSRKPITVCRHNRSTEKSEPNRPGIFRDEHGLHVFGMLDPARKAHKSNCLVTKTTPGITAIDPEMPKRVCRWIVDSLGISVPFAKAILSPHDRQVTPLYMNAKHVSSIVQKVYRSFQSGVLLCKITEAVQTSSTQTGLDLVDDITVQPWAWSAHPQGRADFIRNIAVARAALQKLGVPSNELEVLSRLTTTTDNSPLDTVNLVWKILDSLREIIARQVAKTALSGVATTVSTSQHCGNTTEPQVHPLARESGPFCQNESTGTPTAKFLSETITSSQTAEVNEWLHSLGFDVKKSPRGTLHDTLRNGELLRSLHARFLRHQDNASTQPPKSIDEARENITAVLKDLAELIPASIKEYFLSLQAVDDILFGNCLSVYILLWHLRRRWIFQTGEAKTPSADKSPLVLDIPAITLADLRFRQTQSVSAVALATTIHNTADCIEWNSLSSNDEDLYPVKPSDVREAGNATANTLRRSAQFEESEQTENHPDGCLKNVDSQVEEIKAAAHQVCSKSPTDQVPPKALQTLKQKLGTKRASKRDLARASLDLAVTREHIESILSWFTDINVHLDHPEALQNSSAPLAEFRSGVLLCRVVEKVEYMRKISGVVHPKGEIICKASAMHNIKKALSILQNKKTMPLHLLRHVQSIYDGDRSVILFLLLQIRMAYMNHPAARRKAPALIKPAPTIKLSPSQHQET